MINHLLGHFDPDDKCGYGSTLLELEGAEGEWLFLGRALSSFIE